MLHRLLVSLRRDNVINLRAQYFTIQGVISVLYVVMILFVVPESTKLSPTIFVADETAERSFAPVVEAGKFDISIAGSVKLRESEAAVRRSTDDNKTSIGVVIRGSASTPSTSLLFQGTEGKKLRNLVAASVEEQLLKATGESAEALPVENLRKPTDPVTFRDGLVPFLLLLDAAAIGMFLIAALIFVEKEDGVLRAYFVTPGRTWEYLFSKSLSLSILAAFMTLIVVSLTIGGGPNYPQLLALIIVGSFCTTLLGAVVAVHFRTFTEFFFPFLLLANAVFALPAVGYFAPTSPQWIKLLPTYNLIAALSESIFPAGNSGTVYGALAMFLVGGLALLWLGTVTFKRQLARA